jgi:hypothetical protein
MEVFALTSAEEIFRQTYTQVRKSFTVRNYPTAGGDLVKRFSSAWQGSFRFWASTRNCQPPMVVPNTIAKIGATNHSRERIAL